MNKVKSVLLAVIATVCCITVLVGGVVCSRQSDVSICSHVEIVVQDSVCRQYVNSHELEAYLRAKGCYSIGKVMRDIDCHHIEQVLLDHNMIRTASCYKTTFGEVCIRVTQRVPIMCVKTQEGKYFVDTDRRIMAYCPDVVGVPTITGAISQRAAVEEYCDFILWLKNHSYWCDRIKNIHVHNPKYIVLTQSNYSAKIVLGQLDDYVNKLARLRKLYRKGFDVLGYPDCRELDLRFTGQVVRR
jgi:cell division protein FtsQ